MAVRAPADKRFRRAQVRPVRRRRVTALLRWRAIRVVLALAILLYAGRRAAMMVLNTSALRVSHVVVRGNERLSTGEVLALLDDLRGRSILVADLEACRLRLLESPWVEAAALRRVLPSTIEVLVSERMPIALGRLAGRLYLVDARGVIIDEYGPQYAELDLPIVDGLTTSSDSGQLAVDDTRTHLAAQLIDALNGHPELAHRVSQIDVHDPHDAVVLLDDDPALIHLGEEHFSERLQSYIELAPVLRSRVPEIDYVDLRFGERVYVRPGTSGQRPSPTAARD